MVGRGLLRHEDRDKPWTVINALFASFFTDDALRTFPMTAATAMWAPATRTPGEVSAAIKRIWLSHCADV
jgi:hypothetical protein